MYSLVLPAKLFVLKYSQSETEITDEMFLDLYEALFQSQFDLWSLRDHFRILYAVDERIASLVLRHATKLLHDNVLWFIAQEPCEIFKQISSKESEIDNFVQSLKQDFSQLFEGSERLTDPTYIQERATELEFLIFQSLMT